VWFGYRVLRLGGRPAFCPQALAHHAVFARGWREYVAERWRLQYFPAMAAKMPELRRAFFYHRLFLSPRSARLDSCLAGGALALALGSPLPLALAVPYQRLLRRHAYRAPAAGRAPGMAAADLAADLLGVAALAKGSARHGSLVI